jgi:hypothetical protein
METDPNTHSSPEKMLAEREQKIQALEQALHEARESAQKYSRDREAWQQKFDETAAAYQARLRVVEDDARQWQHDYETLRVQKGGFGFKALLIAAMGGAFFGAVACYIFFRPADHDAQAFARFQQKNLFKYEYALSQGNFEEVEESLRLEAARPENDIIQPELEFARKLVGAAKRKVKSEK